MKTGHLRPIRVARVAVIGAMFAASALLAPGQANAAELGITLVHLRHSSIELSVVCPVDPPTTVLVSVGEPPSSTLIGHQPIDCVGGGVAQDVTVPLSPALAADSHVYISATVSGDSGEINASFPSSLVEADSAPPEATVPSPPTVVGVTAGRTTATVTWREPVTNGGSAVDSYRVKGDGTSRTVASTVRRMTFRGLKVGHRYVFRVAAHNAKGFSEAVKVVTRTKPRACAPARNR